MVVACWTGKRNGSKVLSNIIFQRFRINGVMGVVNEIINKELWTILFTLSIYILYFGKINQFGRNGRTVIRIKNNEVCTILDKRASEA